MLGDERRICEPILVCQCSKSAGKEGMSESMEKKRAFVST